MSKVILRTCRVHPLHTKSAGLVLVVCVASMIGCVPSSPRPLPGQSVTRVDVSTTTAMEGLGIGSQEIVEIADKMMRSLLASPAIVQSDKTPTIAIGRVRNNSRFRISATILAKKLKANLNSKAFGRMVFIARDQHDLVEAERYAKRQGEVDHDPERRAKKPHGVDFFLVGSIDGVNQAGVTGMSDYLFITFQLVDAESGAEAWEDQFEFKKEGRDDVIYR